MQQTEPIQVDSVKKLRACMRCHLVKSQNQWQKDGFCENCDFFTSMGLDVFNECTTPHFDGMLSIIHPKTSWLSRYLKLSVNQPGIYCLKVGQKFTEGIQQELEEKGIKVN